MRIIATILLALTLGTVDPPTAERRLLAPAGSSDGVRGNTSLERGDHGEAARRYEAGISRAEGDIRARLLSNRGLLHLQNEEIDQARTAFETAYASATTSTERARAAYNAGLAATAEEDLAAAASLFRNALLAVPGYDDARHNLEIVKRLLNEQEAPDENQDEGAPDQQEPGDEENDEQEPQPDDEGAENDEEEGESPEDSEGDQPDPETEGDQQEPGDAEQGDGDQPEQPGGEQPGPDGSMSPEDAERILRAIEDEEAEVLRDIQRRRAGTQSHERDW